MYKIAVIDDEKDICVIMKGILETNKDYDVVYETNSKKGLDLIFKEKPDLAILDVVMPEINGIEMLKALKKQVETYHIPIIILTGYRNEEDKYMAEAIESYADMFMLKPFKHADLLAKVEVLLAKRQEEKDT